MAGKGFAPRDPKGLRVLTAMPTMQPELPEVAFEVDGELVEFVWPARTLQWWSMWRDSPLAADFTSTDWSELLDTALLHARYWKGEIKLAAEIRLRVASFGATPADRARLRITFAAADEADEKRSGPRDGGARARRGPLKSVPPASGA